ncbi:NAD(P)H-quinone oxidoreductase subunit N-like isoform X1 [Carya illinoinensis]|uniref:Uncharacterized protein n=1 Tax=Carya illinoinensis TaxID=32201 RepID=A0A8T1NM59_CARIL|nr:NAD(P)H-quinone oxidoreductase subunit N-like isoform X1 [Carya illinoinensis]KAG6631018.1 hypothetical protein CIPAW_13G061300 [Carya illinoinensis]
MVHQPHSKLHQKQLKTGNNCMFDITMVGKRSLMMMGLRGGHCKANKRAHLGKQPIARWYFPPEVDYRLDALPPDAKGLVVWIIEAKVLSMQSKPQLSEDEQIQLMKHNMRK